MQLQPKSNEGLRICSRTGVHTCRLGSIHLNEREAGFLKDYLAQKDAEVAEMKSQLICNRDGIHTCRLNAIHVPDNYLGTVEKLLTPKE